jgi:hypothetical protein
VRERHALKLEALENVASRLRGLGATEIEERIARADKGHGGSAS